MHHATRNSNFYGDGKDVCKVVRVKVSVGATLEEFDDHTTFLEAMN